MMAQRDLSVSVVSSNYNNAPFLESFFESVLGSSRRPDELIIVDDCSTDHSREILERYSSSHSWIKPVLLPENQGVANATNQGLNKSQGKYVLRVDPDDILMPHRIATQLEFMENHPQIDVLGGNCWYIDAEDENRISRSRFPAEEEDIVNLFRRGENGVLNGTTLVKRAWFEKVKYRQEMVWAEDYDLFARMLYQGARFAAIDKPQTLVRIHRGSATSNLHWDTIRKAYELSKELFHNRRSRLSVYRNFLHLRHYRKHLLETIGLRRFYHLCLASALRPDKVIKTLRNK